MKAGTKTKSKEVAKMNSTQEQQTKEQELSSNETHYLTTKTKSN